MRKIFCFIDKQESITGEIDNIINKFDSLGDDVFLYTDICGPDSNPVDILYTIDTVLKKDETNITKIFISNITNLFQIIYRLYHQIFDYFFYFYQQETLDYSLGEVYRTIFSMQINESEMLYKTVYSNLYKFSINNFNCKIQDYSKLYNIDLLNQTEKNTNNDDLPILLRKYYYINGTYYFFEPILTDKKVVIRPSINRNLSEISSLKFRYPGYDRMGYQYHYNNGLIQNLFQLLFPISAKSIEDIYTILDVIENDIPDYYPYIFKMTCCILDDAIQLDNDRNILDNILLLSFLMQVTGRSDYLNLMLTLAIQSNVLNCDNKYYIWNQVKRYLLSGKAAGDAATEDLMQKLYMEAFNGYREKLDENLNQIPKGKRDENLIVVFTIQFLSERHAPTRTTLERCYTLAKLLGKKILLINTKEQYTTNGIVLLHHPCSGNIIAEYSKITAYQYKDLSIPFFQPGSNMPSINEIKQIIERIKAMKPFMIFSIGNGSITADLCGRIVPEAAIGVAFSNLPTTAATFSVIGRTISESEWDKLVKKGYQKDNIIESTFTFELIPKKSKFSRKELDIPENKFILVTVGIRLDTEIDDEFIETVQKSFRWGTHIVFAGNFSRYEYFCNKYSELQINSTFIGYCEDILALMEICDLYVNPRRLGGGFSIVEAFHEGKPGVTIDTGDISVAAGQDFCVKNYDEMLMVINKYIEDKDFYEMMVEKALEREKEVTDSAKSMDAIIKQIQENALFF